MNVGEEDSRSVERGGRNRSEHGKHSRTREALTSCQTQEGQVKTEKESAKEKLIYVLSSTEE